MKKKLIALFAMLTALFALGGCSCADAGDNSSSEPISQSSDTNTDTSTDTDTDSSLDANTDTDSSSDTNTDKEKEYLYKAFTPAERSLFIEAFGFVVPFVPNDDYYVEEYSEYYEDNDITEIGVNFYAYDLTQTEFNGYKALFTTANGYTSDGTEVDEYGDTWYYFTKNGVYVDISYYETEDGYVIDVYVYIEAGNGSGSGGGNQGGDSGTDVDLITNDGKGLPAGTNGVYNVDFTDATYVKNVTEQGDYEGGCPTTGQPQVLVVPVEFSDVTAASKGYTIDKIKAAFEKDGKTDYFSVYDYYYQASYGQLDIQFTVLNSWFKPSKASTYYATQTIEYYGSQVEAGDQIVMNELLAYLDGQGYDLSQFDSDNNGMIDAVVFITTLEINSDVTYYWAYRYWNLYTDKDGNYYEYDGVSANDYLWAPYQFLYETYDEDGYTIYDENVMNTYTFIHEFGHVLGADDYYDTSYSGNAPMDGRDIMDGMLGDHNAFTKFNYGWLTSSRLVVAEESVTLTLEDFSKNGDTIIIANNWDATLGAYQEYYVLVYVKNTGLNDTDLGAGYFARDGVVVYHVNASLYKEEEDGEVYYDIYNNNTDASDEYGTVDNLIEYVKSANDTFTYVAGDTMPVGVTNDSGDTLAYNFVVDSITDDVATITFTKNQ